MKPIHSMPSNDRFDDFDSAGRALFVRLIATVRRRLAALYPSAPPEILGSAAEAAVRSARRYDDCAELKDCVLHQAIRTVIRHVDLAYDKTLKALGGWLDDDLYRVFHAKFCDLANLIAFEYAKPRAAAPVSLPKKQRRTYPPQVRRRR